VGAHNLSESEPLKRAGFPLKYDEFEGAAGYNVQVPARRAGGSAGAATGGCAEKN
jgi:hypothetical protein